MLRRNHIQWFIEASACLVHIHRCVNIHIYKMSPVYSLREMKAVGEQLCNKNCLLLQFAHHISYTLRVPA